MASELVNMATSEKLKEMDWTKNIEICELVAREQGQANYVIKQIKKRLGSKHPNAQLFAVMLLEMLMNSCGEHIHKLVIDNGLLPILVKIVKKKTVLPVRERIFLLLDATQTILGGASGKFPQYYAAYYKLVMGALKKLVEEGKIKYIGLYEASASTIRRAHVIHLITAVQLEWSLWTRDSEEDIIPTCRATVITAYLMRTEKRTLEDALESLRDCCEFVCANDGFLDQLKLFEDIGFKVDTSNPLYKRFRIKVLDVLESLQDCCEWWRCQCRQPWLYQGFWVGS